MKLLTVFCIILLISACASVPAGAPPGTAATPTDASQTKLAIATHADLLAAAAYATAHGLPAIAAVYASQDANLTAVEGQITACNAAILANMPQLASPPAGAGPILVFEIAREAVGNFAGVAPAVKLACEPITIPPLPVLPRIP